MLFYVENIRSKISNCPIKQIVLRTIRNWAFKWVLFVWPFALSDSLLSHSYQFPLMSIIKFLRLPQKHSGQWFFSQNHPIRCVPHYELILSNISFPISDIVVHHFPLLFSTFCIYFVCISSSRVHIACQVCFEATSRCTSYNVLNELVLLIYWHFRLAPYDLFHSGFVSTCCGRV